MSVVAPPAPAATPTPPHTVAAKRDSPWRLMAFGGLLVVLLVGAAGVVIESFGGAFSTYAVAEAQLPASSTAVALSAPVEYRNVTVGTVASQGRSVPGGLVDVTLHLERSMLHVIPAGVEATETPVSFFGDAYIVLVAPARPGTARLRPGATIPALQVGQTASLQATLGDLDTLLIKLHPAQLDAALTALAGSLQNNGTSFGHNLVRANTYFRQMLPLWPTVVSNLDTLQPVANQFASSTPDILRILANQTTTATTVNDQAATVRQAIGGGETLTGQAAQLLGAIQQPFNVLAADSGPFLKAVAQNPEEISQLLQGLDDWARAWTAAVASGPSLDLTENQVVVNPADLGMAVLGGPQAAAYLEAGLGAGSVNPATYSSAGAIPATTTAADRASALMAAVSSAPAPVMAEPAQARAVARIVGAMSGAPPASGAVSTLLLSPLLEALVTRG
ncbi:MAG TPA: MCE family protein [Acidimicrobiales bacterium]|jgi:virulence factor Mce-like protein